MAVLRRAHDLLQDHYVVGDHVDQRPTAGPLALEVVDLLTASLYAVVVPQVGPAPLIGAKSWGIASEDTTTAS